MNLRSVFVLGGAELTSRSGGLLEVLLLLSVRKADLDSVIFTVDVDDLVIETFDDLVTCRA